MAMVAVLARAVNSKGKCMLAKVDVDECELFW
jgi:hypothetical protein